MKTYLEFKDSKSQKFWSIEVDGKSTLVVYGKIGTPGRNQTKNFDSTEDAMKAAEKLINQKKKKGYQGADPFTSGKECQLNELRDLEGMSAAVEFFKDMFVSDLRAFFWAEDLSIEGDFWLDSKKYTGNRSHISSVNTFVIVGDLHVSGTIVNNEGDFGMSLIVLGNIVAKNAIFGGSNVFVAGDINLSGYGVAFYNHGTSLVQGLVSAKAIVNHDNHFGYEYAVGTQVLEWGGRGEHCLADLRLEPFVDDGYPKIGKIISAVLAGTPFLDRDSSKTSKR